MKFALFIAGLLMVGCAHIVTGYKQVPGPNGDIMYEAYCNGRQATFGNCMEVAAKVCGGAYKILAKDSQTGFVDDVSTHRKQMLFTCGGQSSSSANPSPIE